MSTAVLRSSGSKYSNFGNLTTAPLFINAEESLPAVIQERPEKIG
jgi:hypothetical protein